MALADDFWILRPFNTLFWLGELIPGGLFIYQRKNKADCACYSLHRHADRFLFL